MTEEKNDGGGYRDGDGGTYGDGGGGTLCPSSSSLKQPSSERSYLPRFLTKLLHIVNDPNTDHIISWGSFNTSFIIWDYIKFSTELLPVYYKHNKFSSFIYQLNNYGFKKIGVTHQWEYDHPYFQPGKEYLLANIKRRSDQVQEPVKRRRKRADIHNIHDIEEKLEILRNEVEESKLEIEELMSQQGKMELHILTMEANLENSKNESEDVEISKKRKLDDAKIDKAKTNVEMEDLNDSVLVPVDDFERPVEVNYGIDLNCEVKVKTELGGYKYLEQIMLVDDDDDEVCENEADGTREGQEVIVAELKDLIAN